MEPLIGKSEDSMEKLKQELIVQCIRGVARELLKNVRDQLGRRVKERLSTMEFEKFVEEYEKDPVKTKGIRDTNKQEEMKDRWR
jgi:hypothetical protein